MKERPVMPASENAQLIHADCMEAMKHIADGSVDMVCADVPYGTTQCAWDSALDLELMWEHLHRIAKPNAAIVLFSASRIPLFWSTAISGIGRRNGFGKKATLLGS